MRSLVVTNIVSLDGRYEGAGSGVMALPMDPAFDAHNLERLEAAATLLVGADTFRLFLGYWPEVHDDPTQPEVEREISRRNNAIEKVVVSDTLTPDDLGAWRDTTRVVARADAADEVRRLKGEGDGDIVTFGSRRLWNALLAQELVDEIHMMVGAVLLGDGTPIADPQAASPLRLLDVRRFDGSDNVVLRYGVGGR